MSQVDRMKCDTNKYFTLLRDPGLIEHTRQDGDEVSASSLEDIALLLKDSERFDCKRLDAAFVRETGLERLAELSISGERCHLPFDSCLFEFESFVVMAKEVIWFSTKEVPVIEARSVAFDGGCDLNTFVEVWSSARHELAEAEGEGPNKEAVLITVTSGGDKDEDREWQKTCAVMMLGVLVLMEEKLIRETRVAVAGESVNSKRLRKGKAPISPYRILTLNLAEATRRAGGHVLFKHESPRLHWRRGHWRTLGRLSEFERRTWVKRCLVGDPSKGFVQKHYALTYQPLIH